MEASRENLLERLNKTVDALFAIYQGLSEPQVMIYELWSAKDVLAHLTFWHESFACNVNDLTNGRKPTPLKGRLSDLNQSGVDTMRADSLETVLKRFACAHEIIRRQILNPALTCIPYRKGSRDYSPEEHLDIVDKHIHEHLRDV